MSFRKKTIIFQKEKELGIYTEMPARPKDEYLCIEKKEEDKEVDQLHKVLKERVAQFPSTSSLCGMWNSKHKSSVRGAKKKWGM
jgi:translation initiation factor 6 (eIF-6)